VREAASLDAVPLGRKNPGGQIQRPLLIRISCAIAVIERVRINRPVTVRRTMPPRRRFC
jgi:hypothetical protein